MLFCYVSCSHQLLWFSIQLGNCLWFQWVILIFVVSFMLFFLALFSFCFHSYFFNLVCVCVCVEYGTIQILCFNMDNQIYLSICCFSPLVELCKRFYISKNCGFCTWFDSFWFDFHWIDFTNVVDSYKLILNLISTHF
jgi:hypothetical protein